MNKTTIPHWRVANAPGQYGKYLVVPSQNHSHPARGFVMGPLSIWTALRAAAYANRLEERGREMAVHS